MNRYILKPGFDKTDRELLRKDFNDYLFLLTFKLLPEASNSAVKDGYKLFINDLALAITLIDKADRGELSGEDAKNTVLFCKSTHKLFLDSFYDESFLKSEAYISLRKG